MAETARKKAQARNRAWWAEQITKCEASGMTLVAYAKENGLRLGSLYRWKTVLGRTITAKREIVKAETEPRALKFLEVSVEQPRSSNRVEIVTPRGWTVRVEVNADNGALSRVLDLVEGRR